MTPTDPKPHWAAADIAAVPETEIRHPWNPDAQVFVKPLAMAAGLSRVVLTLGRLPPGKDSVAYHCQERDEEFLYILSGRGRAEIGDRTVEIGPGDFMGFPAPGVAHNLTNPYDEDLVYLMGGERSGFDIGHFPKLGRRIVFGPTGVYGVDDSALTPMTLADWMPAARAGDGPS